jgi:hypothetical protein
MNATRTCTILCFVLAAQAVLSGAPYTVTNTNDDGPGSLRQALASANANSESDLIAFNILGSGPHTIALVTALPEIGDSVTIDGYTQTGASPATAASPAVLKIVLDGGNLPSPANGLQLNVFASHCVIRGLQTQGFACGLGIQGDYNTALGNHLRDGVFLTGAHNTIGGPTPAERNVIGGHRCGASIFPEASYNSLQGNYIGTDATGTYADTEASWDGVSIAGTHNSVTDNLISGYLHHGVLIMRWSAGHPIPEYNVVERNSIGTNAAGTAAIPNGNGITINSGRENRISANLISGNRYHGIVVTNAFLPLSTGNRITANSIFDNDEIGINLYDEYSQDWVTPNDPHDTDIGPNNLMNYPVLTSARATPGQLIVQGTIDTQNPRQAVLEFFANSTADATGYGEGEVFLGTATPNAQGKFTAALPAVTPGTWISATATDAAGNTSEFALSVEAAGLGKP